jgi:hypothetical protein
VAEVCNGLDDDCDGAIDDDPTDGDVFWGDADQDGWGDDAVEIVACDTPEGYATIGEDCDDADDAQNPFVAERCNGEDDDCNGKIDDGAPGSQSWWADDDRDGYGDPKTELAACSRPDGFVGNDEDCNDRNRDANPDATEVCNDGDDDCDGKIDEDACEDPPPEVTITWEAKAVSVSVTNLVGTGFDLGIAETESGEAGWYGEDCYMGTGSYRHCHPFTGSTGKLTSVYPDISKVVKGKTTLFTEALAYDSADRDRLTYVVIFDDASCMVTGHEPAYYASFGCAES